MIEGVDKHVSWCETQKCIATAKEWLQLVIANHVNSVAATSTMVRTEGMQVPGECRCCFGKIISGSEVGQLRM